MKFLSFLLLLLGLSNDSVCGAFSVVSTTTRTTATERQSFLLSSLHQSSSSFSLAAAASSSGSDSSVSSPPTTTTVPAIELSQRVSEIQPSKTVEIFSLVKQLQAEGHQITSLCVGEPDFQPPQAVLDALQQALREGDTKYTAVTGTLDLRRAIRQDLADRKQITTLDETDIVVGNGAKQCVYQAILATVGPGDAVLIPAPYWPSYPEMVVLAGAEPVLVPTASSDGFLLTPSTLRTTLEQHPNAKLLIFCNPSNPTGGVHDQERLQELVSVLEDYPRVSVLADEIYERLVYRPGMTSSPAMAALLPDRTITINGFSKAYAMTGFRLGYAAAPPAVAKAMATIQSQLTSCASSLSQAAGVAALQQVSEDELQTLYDAMKEKRDYVVERLRQIPHVSLPVVPEGAFYLLPDVSHYCEDKTNDTQLCLDLLQSHGLALVPGSSFGAPGTIRISYATSMEELDTAMTKFEQFLQSREAQQQPQD